ncbi:hypothetical protein BDC45DRAFT_511139 [Circinella umbellata]|nr:hypothetical protein BDC45DRAFT_511139 [Circinella umbellata]
MPPKTKASARKTENKTTNGTAQKRSVRGGNKATEIKKNAKAQESKPIKKGKVVKEVVEEEQSVKESDEENEELMTEEQEEALRKEILGDMASDDEESDEEEKEDDQAISGDAFNSAEDVISLDPEQVKKSKEETKAKFDKKKKAPVTTEKEDERGVIYLGRIPHGFYEDEMKGYFSQFGTVSQLRLARNKRGQPKHYGFIEFESAQVADIVADTMDNYLLLGHILQCKVLPKESIHPNLFKGTSKRFRKVNPSIIQQKKHNQTRSEEKQKKRIIDLLKAENERRKKIKELGIDYEFPGYVS